MTSEMTKILYSNSWAQFFFIFGTFAKTHSITLETYQKRTDVINKNNKIKFPIVIAIIPKCPFEVSKITELKKNSKLSKLSQRHETFFSWSNFTVLRANKGLTNKGHNSFFKKIYSGIIRDKYWEKNFNQIKYCRFFISIYQSKKYQWFDFVQLS